MDNNSNDHSDNSSHSSNNDHSGAGIPVALSPEQKLRALIQQASDCEKTNANGLADISTIQRRYLLDILEGLIDMGRLPENYRFVIGVYKDAATACRGKKFNSVGKTPTAILEKGKVTRQIKNGFLKH